MSLTRPCFIKFMSSILLLSLALTGRAPRHCRFTALMFVYGTFKDRTWCYGGLVYISSVFEAKMWFLMPLCWSKLPKALARGGHLF